jgi:hypothetical protein
MVQASDNQASALLKPWNLQDLGAVVSDAEARINRLDGELR